MTSFFFVIFKLKMKKFIFCFLLFGIIELGAQEIIWENISFSFLLPNGVSLFEGKQNAPKLKLWYLKADLSNPNLIIRPYIKNHPAGITDFQQSVGAYAAINGGYFDTGTGDSYSTMVTPYQVKAQNIKVLTRQNKSYYVTRAAWSMNKDKEQRIDWIYHFSPSFDDMMYFENPNPNIIGVPAPEPNKEEANSFEDLVVALGGGPMLIYNNEKTITYDEEVFWESGVNGDINNPRTAIGITSENEAILLVVDGRQSESVGVTLERLADIMLELGCEYAMNLDGGGSSQMAASGYLVNRPEGGTYQRPIPTILAVTHKDSLVIPQEVVFEKIIDTEFSSATIIGNDWFETANSGYYGNSKTLLNQIDGGNDYIEYNLELTKPGKYLIYGWWVSASNRSTATPFLVLNGGDTTIVYKDQTAGGSAWQFIDEINYEGIGETKVIIVENGNPDGNYVAADAVRIISYDSTTITGISRNVFASEGFYLFGNYPNPFNSITNIKFFLQNSSEITLEVSNILGEIIYSEVKYFNKGSNGWSVNFNNFSSGVYLYSLKKGSNLLSGKLILLK